MGPLSKIFGGLAPRAPPGLTPLHANERQITDQQPYYGIRYSQAGAAPPVEVT